MEREDQCGTRAPSNGQLGDNHECFSVFLRKVMELKNLLKFPMTENLSDRNFTSRAMVDVELCNSAEQRNAEGAVECHKHTLPACILKGSLFSITLNTGLIDI